jgi:hypothetical protein
MINQWRCVKYVDDGHYVFQCLKCYEEWDSQQAPGYTDRKTGEYHRYWNYCPLCATRWDKQWIIDPDRDDENQFGPRRARIVDAGKTHFKPPFYWAAKLPNGEIYRYHHCPGIITPVLEARRMLQSCMRQGTLIEVVRVRSQGNTTRLPTF